MSSLAFGQRLRVSRGGCWQCVPDCRSQLAEVLTFSRWRTAKAGGERGGKSQNKKPRKEGGRREKEKRQQTKETKHTSPKRHERNPSERGGGGGEGRGDRGKKKMHQIVAIQ